MDLMIVIIFCLAAFVVLVVLPLLWFYSVRERQKYRKYLESDKGLRDVMLRQRVYEDQLRAVLYMRGNLEHYEKIVSGDLNALGNSEEDVVKRECLQKIYDCIDLKPGENFQVFFDGFMKVINEILQMKIEDKGYVDEIVADYQSKIDDPATSAFMKEYYQLALRNVKAHAKFLE